MNIFINS